MASDSFTCVITSGVFVKATSSTNRLLLFESSVHFDKDYMKTQPIEAIELGCDPDFNAYLKQENELFL